MDKRKGISIILIVFMLLTLVVSGNSVNVFATSPTENKTVRAGTVTITSENDLVSSFPDANFRAIVFKAVRDGQENAVGINIKDALANFTGQIKANGRNKSYDKKIKDVTGIDLLRKAEIVDIRYNEIKDFSKLGENAQSGTNLEEFKTYYGFEETDLERVSGTNVKWDIGGNPIELLAHNYGGRLDIAQAGSASYTYPTDQSLEYVYFRNQKIGTVSGKININKAKILDENKVEKNVSIISVSPVIIAANGDKNIGLKILNYDKKTNATADFELKTSGSTHISVGVNQELHYWTADEYGFITPGSQSFKYYLTPKFDVYDVVQGYSSYGHQAKLIKTDKDTKKPVQGAVYNIYKENGELYIGDLETNKDGTIRPVITKKGKYYFQEVSAPEGYLLNNEKIPFEIDVDIQETQWDIIVDGGIREIDLKNAGTITERKSAADFETNINNQYHKATFLSATSAPLELSTAPDNHAKVIGVHVTFANFLDRFGIEQKNYTRYYDTLEQAETDINKIVSENRNYGAIKIVQVAENMDKDIVIEKNTTDMKIYKTSATVEKKWIDGNETSRPKEVKVSLYRSDKKEPIANAILNSQNKWSYTFKNLLSTDQYGKEYKFSIKEENIDGYTLTSNEVSRINNGKDWRFVLTNTSHTNPPTPDIPPKPPLVKTNDGSIDFIPLIALLIGAGALIFVVRRKKN